MCSTDVLGAANGVIGQAMSAGMRGDGALARKNEPEARPSVLPDGSGAE